MKFWIWYLGVARQLFKASQKTMCQRQRINLTLHYAHVTNAVYFIQIFRQIQEYNCETYLMTKGQVKRCTGQHFELIHSLQASQLPKSLTVCAHLCLCAFVCTCRFLQAFFQRSVNLASESISPANVFAPSIH